MKNSSKKNLGKKNSRKWAFVFLGIATALVFAFLFVQAKTAAVGVAGVAAGEGGSASIIAGAPPDVVALLPFAAFFGVALIMILSALVWYAMIELD